VNVYSYKITRDYGFAPNPFFGICTLACCKPNIRKKALVGDWIIGTGSVENDLLYNLIFLMKVTEKVSFQEYWDTPKYSKKKPLLNGSLKQIHGDNIYYKEANNWCQLNSHHSLPEGQLNNENLRQDLSGKSVLISNEFVYLGSNAIPVDEKYHSICPNSKQRDYITVQNIDMANEFISEILKKYPQGINGDPINWKEYAQLSLF